MTTPSTRPESPEQSLHFQIAQNSAEIARARLTGGATIPEPAVLQDAMHNSYRVINALRFLLGRGRKGGAA